MRNGKTLIPVLVAIDATILIMDATLVAILLA